MDEAQIAKDAAIAFFYFVGGIAVIVGGLLAARRFFFERPYEPLWGHEVQDCRVRRIQKGEAAGKFVYTVLIRITNRSKSWQSITQVWAKTVLPDESDFPTDAGGIGTAADARRFFGQASQPQPPSEIGPGESYSFGQGVVYEHLEHVLRVLYAFEFPQKRMLLPGYNDEPAGLDTASTSVSVNLDDLKYYQADGKPPP